MDEMEIRGSSSKACNILAVLPRRFAVTSLSSYIYQKRGYFLGKKIGYQVGIQTAVRSRGTKIMFVTIGVFLQRACNVLSKSEDPSKEDPLAG
ncbi:hypothetical protein RvY_12929 [Ramazzottius varieornatus]|uniref:Uncharacterized protein n=1 Tax=Ramazzottius varieornatus TaxID=947166 RepID=A0A1D1VL59_RAMVA|nr:hypothetical protein RvY_12929 [Ramazzottius varieornatus]